VRRSGILLHPSSLPSIYKEGDKEYDYGIGDFGKNAYEFIDFLFKSKQSIWQVLPLNPTGYGDSPYASTSSFAGNPLLISLHSLKYDGYLFETDLNDLFDFDKDKVDYSHIYYKIAKLKIASDNFLNLNKENEAYNNFKNENAFWLDDYALFSIVKDYFLKKGQEENIEFITWNTYWDKDIALREDKAIKKYREFFKKEIEQNKVIQYFFFKQWLLLKKYANSKGIKIIGDIPIFVAMDSADVWINRELFDLNDDALPNKVAGVPPDYFSSTGQLWGNPLYKWDLIEEDNFTWWIKRIKQALLLYDIVRIDHFRGFESYWAVNYGQKDAIKGEWLKAPGLKLFEAIKKTFGKDLPIIAEDLGVITPEVEALRDEFNLAGMKIMQFAFEFENNKLKDNAFLSHNYIKNCIAYTGTHDNDTTKSWLTYLKNKEKEIILKYVDFNSRDRNEVWSFIKTLFRSSANFVVIPMQDILNLDTTQRMNTPSTLGINWMYKLKFNDIQDELIKELSDLSILYSRNKYE